MKLPSHISAEDLIKVIPFEVLSEFDWNDFDRMTKLFVNRDCFDKHWFSIERRYELAAKVLSVLPNYKYLDRKRCVRVICIRYYLPCSSYKPGLPKEPNPKYGYWPMNGEEIEE